MACDYILDGLEAEDLLAQILHNALNNAGVVTIETTVPALR